MGNQLHIGTAISFATRVLRDVAAQARPILSRVAVISPILGASSTPRVSAASAGRETKARQHGAPARDVAAEQLPDTRRLLQLGLVFAMAYVVFLICWFWATRARRGRTRDIRL